MKERTLNEYRQTKEYQGSSEGRKYLDDLDPVKKVMAQQIDEELESQPWDTSKYGGGFKKVAFDESKHKDIAGDEFMLKQAKDLIVNKLQDRFYDIIFQAVADEMSKNYMFRQNNYLTEAGEELFEDAWFEWYHEQHSDILYRVLQTLEP